MKRLKKMPVSIRKDLEKAGEMILTYRPEPICVCIGKIWLTTKEAEMLRPSKNYCDSLPWWGLDTIGVVSTTNEAHAARLMGIAIMITMPEEIINHECSQK